MKVAHRYMEYPARICQLRLIIIWLLTCLPFGAWSQSTGPLPSTSGTPSAAITTGGRGGGGGGSNISAGAVTGIVVGCIAVVCVIALVSMKARKRNHTRRNAVSVPVPLCAPEVLAQEAKPFKHRAQSEKVELSNGKESAASSRSDTFQSLSGVTNGWPSQVKISDSLQLFPRDSSVCVSEENTGNESSGMLNSSQHREKNAMHQPALPPLPEPRRKEFNPNINDDSPSPFPNRQKSKLRDLKSAPDSLLASADVLFGPGRSASNKPTQCADFAGDPLQAVGRQSPSSPVSIISQTEPLSHFLEDLNVDPASQIMVRSSSRLSRASPKLGVEGSSLSSAGWMSERENNLVQSVELFPEQSVAVISHTTLPASNFTAMESQRDEPGVVYAKPTRRHKVTSLGSISSRTSNNSGRSLRKELGGMSLASKVEPV